MVKKTRVFGKLIKFLLFAIKPKLNKNWKFEYNKEKDSKSL